MFKKKKKDGEEVKKKPLKKGVSPHMNNDKKLILDFQSHTMGKVYREVFEKLAILQNFTSIMAARGMDQVELKFDHGRLVYMGLEKNHLPIEELAMGLKINPLKVDDKIDFLGQVLGAAASLAYEVTNKEEGGVYYGAKISSLLREAREALASFKDQYQEKKQNESTKDAIADDGA